MTGGKERIILLKRLTVKDATSLQLGASREERNNAHQLFISEAHDRRPGEGGRDEELVELRDILALCWAIDWENKNKEVFWRLCVDGVADGHRWHIGVGQECMCGAKNPRRGHFFWECRVAQDVVKVLQGCCPGQPELVKSQLWLMQTPPGVPPDVWKIVCLAAVSSMDVGRRRLLCFKLHGHKGANGYDIEYGARRKRGGRRAAARAPPHSKADKLEAAGRAAVVDFWGRMDSFAALQGKNEGC